MMTKESTPGMSAGTDLDERQVTQVVRDRLPFEAHVAGVTPLAGDASNRRYYRVALSGSEAPASLIVMQLADPEGFKVSEEAVSGSASISNELPFDNILQHFSHTGIPVPSLYHYERGTGLLFLEDWGDTTLTQAYTLGTEEQGRYLYETAIDILVTLHTRSTTPENPACLAFHRSFDVPLLMWEFEHFLEYGVEHRIGGRMNKRDKELVVGEFHKIAQWMAQQPQVLTHRDYHSRNLMVRGKEIGVLDFQDALLGPSSYDLASLLRDAYLVLDDVLIADLLYRYREGVQRAGVPVPSYPEFKRLFDFTSIQRNLKAAGRFVYIDVVKGNPKFLEDIPRTLGYVRKNFEAYSQLKLLHTHLSPYVPEFR